MNFGLFTLRLGVLKVNPISPGKTDENKEADSQIACCNKQEICDMCAECTINTIESHERPKSPQALKSSCQLCSICFFDLTLQLCYCAMATLVASDTPSDILDKELEIHATEKFDTVSSLDAKSDTKKREKFRPGDLHP